MDTTPGSTSIALARSQQSASELYYMAMEMTLSDYISNAAYDLSAPDGGTLGAVNESDVLITPQGFDSITPLELLYTSPQSAFSAQIRRSGTTFTWSPSGGSGYFLIQLDVYNAQGSALVSQIYCLGYDNGTLTVPGSYLSSMPSGGLVAVHLNRYSLDEIVLSNNGSTLETAAASGVLGTGIISN